MSLADDIRKLFGSAFIFVRGFGNGHHGIDLSAARGTPIRAVEGGRVSWTGYAGNDLNGSGAEQGTPSFNFGGGNTVNIVAPNDLTHQYAHLDRVNVKPGQIIKPGDIIGTVGSTGNSSGPHLHFAVWNGRDFVDPARAFENAGQSTADRLRSIGISTDREHVFTYEEGLKIANELYGVTGSVAEAIARSLQGTTVGDFEDKYYSQTPTNTSADPLAALGTIATAFQALVDFLAVLIDPANWIRILAILAGAAMTAYGAVGIMRAAA